MIGPSSHPKRQCGIFFITVASGRVPFYFSFDKRSILTLQRYKLYSSTATTQCPKNIIDAHNQNIIIRRKRRRKNLATMIYSL
jgi:hypothetical protein